MLYDNLKRQMVAINEEHKAKEEAQARRSDALEAMMKEMMEKQAKP